MRMSLRQAGYRERAYTKARLAQLGRVDQFEYALDQYGYDPERDEIIVGIGHGRTRWPVEWEGSRSREILAEYLQTDFGCDPTLDGVTPRRVELLQVGNIEFRVGQIVRIAKGFLGATATCEIVALWTGGFAHCKVLDCEVWDRAYCQVSGVLKYHEIREFETCSTASNST